MLPAFEVLRPVSVDEAVGLLDEDNIPYWGGTELLLAMKMGLLVPDGVVDLKRISELRTIRCEADRLVIGAGATHEEVANNASVRSVCPLLSDVESRVGNARVRAQGTIGGNLCFAEPRSDIATILMALDGQVTLRSSGGIRVVPIAEFMLGAYWTAREPGELLVDVWLLLPSATGVYLKFQVTERPTVGVAAVVLPGGSTCRLVIGAVGELPRVFDFPNWESVDAGALAEAVEPVPDLTGSVEYKRHVTAVFIRRAIAAIEGAGTDD